MTSTLDRVRELVRAGKARISDHGYNELAEDGILVGEIMAGLELSVIVEDYPDYAKGPCVLVLERGDGGLPIHALWGIPKGAAEPAVLVTAYRPDPARWDSSFLRRR